MADVHLDVIRHALKVARERGFSEVELEFGDTQFEAKLSSAQAQAVTPMAVISTPEQLVPKDDGFISITAPVVGYLRDSGQPLSAGNRVQKGDVVAVVAALGLANDVESPASGEVVEVLVQPGEPVEYGQVVAKVKVS